MSDIYSRYIFWNRLCFKGKLPRVPIVVTGYMKKVAGLVYFCDYADGERVPIELSISKKYIECCPEALDNILLHEMVHIKNGDCTHGETFLRECGRLKKYGVNITLTVEEC